MTTIGLIVPSSNPTIESFLPVVAGTLDAQFLVTRIGVRRIALDADSHAQFDVAGLVSAASLLADAEVSLVSWAGTSGFWLGGDREDEVLAVASAEAGIQITSSRVAMLAALSEVADARLGVLTPYTSDVHARVLGALSRAGYDIVADRALGVERNLDFAAIPAATVVAELRALAATGAEAAAVVCTNVLATTEVLAVEPLVVIDSVLATLWHATRESGATLLSYVECYRRVTSGSSLGGMAARAIDISDGPRDLTN